MLIILLLQIPIIFISVVSSMFPVVTSLPFGIDVYLITGISNFLYVANQIPPLFAMYTAFMWVLAWKLSLRLFKMIPVVGRVLP